MFKYFKRRKRRKEIQKLWYQFAETVPEFHVYSPPFEPDSIFTMTCGSNDYVNISWKNLKRYGLQSRAKPQYIRIDKDGNHDLRDIPDDKMFMTQVSMVQNRDMVYSRAVNPEFVPLVHDSDEGNFKKWLLTKEINGIS